MKSEGEGRESEGRAREGKRERKGREKGGGKEGRERKTGIGGCKIAIGTLDRDRRR